MSGRHCVALGVVVGSVAGDARGVFSLSCSRTVIASSAQKAWSVWCKRSFFDFWLMHATATLLCSSI